MKKTNFHTALKSSKEQNRLKEDLLHYTWATKSFALKDLKTSEGELIQIHNFGTHNHNAGPDFLNAKISIAKTLWIGNVEIHCFSSDWTKHKHGKDPAYESVILHVVYFEDKRVIRSSGRPLFCLELKDRIAPVLIKRYHRLKGNKSWIPCVNHFPDINPVIIKSMLDKVMVERLESKVAEIDVLLQETNTDWEQCFFICLAKAFGLKINALAFEHLARLTSIQLLSKYSDDLSHIEAILFGQAGFLNHSQKDDYPRALMKEFTFLSELHELSKVPSGFWSLLRLRPAHFPTIRIAQLSKLIHLHNNIFDVFMQAESLKCYYSYFDYEISDYWDKHYLFDKKSSQRIKKPGHGFVDIILINAIIPMMFFYGQSRAEQTLTEKALALLSEIKPEKNRITNKWAEIGYEARSAFESQALLQLRNHYCVPKKCLSCKIGHTCLSK